MPVARQILLIRRTFAFMASCNSFKSLKLYCSESYLPSSCQQLTIRRSFSFLTACEAPSLPLSSAFLSAASEFYELTRGFIISPVNILFHHTSVADQHSIELPLFYHEIVGCVNFLPWYRKMCDALFWIKMPIYKLYCMEVYIQVLLFVVLWIFQVAFFHAKFLL